MGISLLGFKQSCPKLIKRMSLSKKIDALENIEKNKHPVLNLNDVNPNVFDVHYAVRGPILVRTNEIQLELEKGISKKFKKIVKCNIGNCHYLGQKPITFYRQVLSGCVYPEHLENNIFPSDVIERARILIKNMNGSIGCYSESLGIEHIRKSVANYITNRDKHLCDYNNIYLVNGASSGIKVIIEFLIKVSSDGKSTGFMIPIPQYPLYLATITELNGKLIPYYLDEQDDWSLNTLELEKSYHDSLKYSIPKMLVVINPGNPTGQILSYDNMVKIVHFCQKYKLILLADEVYQENIYCDNITFNSFKKVVCDLGYTEKDFSLVSFHSISKGYYGECGIRGGYMELFGFEKNIVEQLTKLFSIQLCASTSGQIVLETVINPPKPDDPSYSLFIKEKNDILRDLKRKAEYTYTELNKVTGIKCNKVQGALYAFPQLNLPQKFIEEAKKKNLKPDEFYCFSLLEETGVCVVPGSGFKQYPGTHHFRITIIPPFEEMKKVISSISDFTNNLFKIYF